MGRHRRRRPSVWRRVLQAVAAGGAAAVIGGAIAVVRRETAVVEPPLPPLQAMSPTSVTLPVAAVQAPQDAASAAAEAAEAVMPTTTPRTTSARSGPRPSPRPSPVPRTTAAKPAPPAASVPSNGTLGQRIVATARTFFGIPYVWGGTSRAGLDCSGLTTLVLRAHGYNPPRTAALQALWTKRIPASQAQPGDLVFKGTPATHVGIYIGNGRMIDAATFGTVVAERPILAGAYFGRIP